MLGRYDRAFRTRWPVGQTLLSRAIAAIRRNNGALFYVPQNLSGVVWTDSFGNALAPAVGEPIGLMRDGAYTPSVGAERVTNGDFSSGVASWNSGRSGVLSSSGGVLRVTNGGGIVSGGADQQISTTPGKSYRLKIQITGRSGSDVGYLRIAKLNINTATISDFYVNIGGKGIGWHKCYFTASSASAYVFLQIDGGTNGSWIEWGNVSVQEVPGPIATQPATANKPTMQRPVANNIIRFDASNDSLSINLASGGSPFVRSYTRTGTVSGATSATTSGFVLGQPTVAGLDVCAIVCAPAAITGADLTAIERWAASIGATL